MNDCTSCANAIWCPTWAEWKCLVHKRYYAHAMEDCSSFKPKGKTFEDPKCQCDDCLANAEE